MPVLLNTARGVKKKKRCARPGKYTASYSFKKIRRPDSLPPSAQCWHETDGRAPLPALIFCSRTYPGDSAGAFPSGEADNPTFLRNSIRLSHAEVYILGGTSRFIVHIRDWHRTHVPFCAVFLSVSFTATTTQLPLQRELHREKFRSNQHRQSFDPLRFEGLGESDPLLALRILTRTKRHVRSPRVYRANKRVRYCFVVAPLALAPA